MNRLTTIWRSAFRDERGSIAIQMTLVMLVLTTFAGAAIDLSRANNAKMEIRAALDAAALAVIGQEGLDADARKEQVEKFFNLNFNGQCATNIDVTFTDGILTGTASCKLPTILLEILGVDEVEIAATTKAGMSGAGQGPLCVHILGDGKEALMLNSRAELNALDCEVHVNSDNRDAVYANSRSTINASKTSIVGRARLNSRSKIIPDAITGADPREDLLEDLSEPNEADDGCDYSDHEIDGRFALLNPGVYCDGLKINSGARVTMRPGIYVIRDKELLLNSDSRLTGDGVMIYLQGEDAALNVNSDSTLSLTPPTSGAYKGITVFQERTNRPGEAMRSIINSGSDTFLEGVFYLPDGHLEMNSESMTNGSTGQFLVIAWHMSMNSGGGLTVKMDNARTDELPDEIAASIGEPMPMLIY